MYKWEYILSGTQGEWERTLDQNTNTNTNTQIQKIHKYKYKYANTKIQIQSTGVVKNGECTLDHSRLRDQSCRSITRALTHLPEKRMTLGGLYVYMHISQKNCALTHLPENFCIYTFPRKKYHSLHISQKKEP